MSDYETALEAIDQALTLMREPMTLKDAQEARQLLIHFEVERKKDWVRRRRDAQARIKAEKLAAEEGSYPDETSGLYDNSSDYQHRQATMSDTDFTRHVAEMAAAISHDLFTKGFEEWFYGPCEIHPRVSVQNSFGGYVGLYTRIAEVAEWIEGQVRDPANWGEKWDFYLTAENAAKVIREGWSDDWSKDILASA